MSSAGLRRLSPVLVALAFALATLSAPALAQDAPFHAGPDSIYPDSMLTPGAVFDGVTADQVCTAGYTRAVRDVTSSERATVYAEYSMPDLAGAAEVDHFIPLELGGSNDLANLWPEPYQPLPGAHEKDRVENYLHEQVCQGAMALADAQQAIVGDWYAVYLSIGPADGLAAVPAADPVPPPSPTVDAP